ncbi:MAG: fimbrillin family protein [Alistipes sp.]|nr:fimbrillin family protein [Alistipes sp.]
METVRRLLLLALPLSLLASCSNNGPDELPGGGTGPGTGEPIKFEIGFAPMTRVATDGQYNCAWEEGNEIGIFANFITVLYPTGNPIHNAKLTYSDGEWTGDIYWPTDITSPMFFFAYYPYDDNGGSPELLNPVAIDFSVASDQREQADHNRSDLLVSISSGTTYGKGQPVSLYFRHSLSLVELTLDNSNRVIDPARELNVTLKYVYSKGSLDIRYNLFTYETAEPEDILMYRLEKPGIDEYYTDYTFRAFVPQQMLKSGERKFVIDNGDITLQNSALTAGVVLIQAEAEQFKQTLPSSVIKPQAEANSYMATPYGRALLIPVSQANRILNGEDLGAITTGLDPVTENNFTVELVWADSPIEQGGVVEAAEAVEIEGEGYIRVLPGRAGNAVIGIKLTGETDYRWSWHIWVTEPVTWATDTETGLIWMDRNLGAAVAGGYDPDGRNGLFYQWGRKDAFPSGDGTDGNQTYYTPAEPGGTTGNIPTDSYTELPELVQNPLNFATNYNSYSGSVIQGSDNDSWGGETQTKTVYDPCPPGWKVPPISIGGNNSWGTEGVWGSWTGNGRIFNGASGTAGLSHFYPACGLRHASDGQLYDQGMEGFYWYATATSFDTHSLYLYFFSGFVLPANSDDRTLGFPVRCVAE